MCCFDCVLFASNSNRKEKLVNTCVCNDWRYNFPMHSDHFCPMEKMPLFDIGTSNLTCNALVLWYRVWRGMIFVHVNILICRKSIFKNAIQHEKLHNNHARQNSQIWRIGTKMSTRICWRMLSFKIHKLYLQFFCRIWNKSTMKLQYAKFLAKCIYSIAFLMWVQNTKLGNYEEQKDKQWSGTDTIRSHILPSKPKGKELNT